jgi:hypothetical protein
LARRHQDKREILLFSARGWRQHYSGRPGWLAVVAAVGWGQCISGKAESACARLLGRFGRRGGGHGWAGPREKEDTGLRDEGDKQAG